MVCSFFLVLFGCYQQQSTHNTASKGELEKWAGSGRWGWGCEAVMGTREALHKNGLIFSALFVNMRSVLLEFK